MDIEDKGNGWKRYSVRQTVPEHRRGWSGLADRLVAWWTGGPINQIEVDYTFSVYAKGDGDLELKIWNSQIEGALEKPRGSV